MFARTVPQEPIVRVVDAEGNLLQAGVWWTQPHAASGIVFSVITFLLTGWAILMGLGAYAALREAFSIGVIGVIEALRLPELAFLLGWLVIAVYTFAVLLRWNRQSHFHQRKMVIFGDDGAILVSQEAPIFRPQDVRKMPRLTRLPKSIEDIASIEVHPDEPDPNKPKPPVPGYSVSLFFKDGRQWVLTEHNRDDLARVLVVQLTIALREMRQSIASRL